MCVLASKINQYGTPVVTGLGMLFSSFGILVFLQIILIKRPRSNMFAYFLIATISDLLNHTIVLFGKLFTCLTCPSWFALTSAGQWYIKFYNYLPAVFDDITAFMQVAATIDCYISIRSKFPVLQSRLTFYLITLFVVFYSFGYEINLWLKYDIVIIERTFNSTLNLTQKIVTYPATSFGKTIWPKVMFVYSSAVRDLGCFVLLLLFNTLIMYEMQDSTRRKKQLIQQRRSNDISMNTLNTSQSGSGIAAVAIMHASTSYSVLKASQAEHKRAIMVVVSGVNYFLGHVGYFPLVIGASFVGFSSFWLCFSYIEIFLLYLSNLTCYAAYYFSNNLFRTFTNQNLLFLFYLPLRLTTSKLYRQWEWK